MLHYSKLEIRALSHLSCNPPYNETNGTATTVIPSATQLASNMNNMLLPPPIPITTTTGLCPITMALMAASYSLRNWLPAPNNP